MMRRLYTLLLYLLLPYILFHLLWRSRRQPEYLRHIGERFGFYHDKPAAPLIWLHAVSVGETRAAVPLVAQLQARYPGHHILLSHMTPTGRETGRQLFGDSVLQCYLPYDFPFATKRFLRHFKPEIGLLMETEIWFNLVQACKKEVPLLLVNARMSENSARKYGRFKTLSRESLQSLSAIAAQAEEGTQTKKKQSAKAPTPEQKAAQKEILEKYDTNKDGKLDKVEKSKISTEDKAKMEKAGMGRKKKGGQKTEDAAK